MKTPKHYLSDLLKYVFLNHFSILFFVSYCFLLQTKYLKYCTFKTQKEYLHLENEQACKNNNTK